MTSETRVSAAELVRNFGYWQEKAISGPVHITHHRRDRLVLLSTEHYNSTLSGTSAPAAVDDLSGAQSRTPAIDLITEMAALLENISDAYILLDPEENILQVNSRLEALWGISRDQLVGRNVHDFVLDQKASFLTQKVKRVLLTRQPETAEIVNLVSPGVHLLSRIYPHPRGVLILHTNITELATLRHENAEAESLKGAIDRHPHVAHAQIDAKGRFIHSDETIQAWTGFDSGTLANTRISDICTPEDRRRVLEAVEDVLGSHVPSALNARFLGRNFSEHDVLLTLAPVMSDQNATALTVIAALTSPTQADPLGGS